VIGVVVEVVGVAEVGVVVGGIGVEMAIGVVEVEVVVGEIGVGIVEGVVDVGVEVVMEIVDEQGVLAALRGDVSLVSWCSL
jgi:hypothetical protein